MILKHRMRLKRPVLALAVMICLGTNSVFAQEAQTRVLTAQEAQDFAKILPHLIPGQAYVLNHDDPTQRRMAIRGLLLAGRNPTNAQQTHAALPVPKPTKAVADGASAMQPLAAAAPGAVQPIADILNFSENAAKPSTQANPVFSATAYSSYPGGTAQTTILVEVMDSATNVVYGRNKATQFAQGTNFSVSVDAPVAKPSNTLVALATITTTPANGPSTTTIISTGQQIAATSASMTQPNYCVKAGTQCSVVAGKTVYKTDNTTALVNPSPISVCFNRGSQQSCDYWNNIARPQNSLFFPLEGSVGFSGATINADQSKGSYSIQLVDPINGGGCKFVNQGALNSAGFSVDSANGLMKWNLAQASLVDPTPCVYYTAGRVMNLSMSLQVALSAPSNKTGFASLDSAYNSASPPGFYSLPALYLEDSCVAAGTMVRMGDGAEAKVESLSADDHAAVETAVSGRPRIVLGTTKGKELHPMIRLKTASGHSLLLTRTHPVLTASGLVMARDLRKGDRVRTEKGLAKLTVVSAENYTGMVYSLRLGELDEPKGPNRTHTANGIFIGDSISQLQMEQEEQARLQSDAEFVARRLPTEAWRTEYRRFLAESK